MPSDPRLVSLILSGSLSSLLLISKNDQEKQNQREKNYKSFLLGSLSVPPTNTKKTPTSYSAKTEKSELVHFVKKKKKEKGVVFE